MAIYQVTAIETKALCSVLRKAEVRGTEALVDAMIEICDTQSGILLQDLWAWWKKHKTQDTEKSCKIIADFMKDLQRIGTPHGDYRITC